jgi:hypothetical protein
MKVSTTNFISLTCSAAQLEHSLCCCVDVEAVSGQTGKSQNAAPIDLFLCVDVSGSMSGVYNQLAKSVSIAARALRSDDRVCVVKFGTNADVVFELAPVSQLDAFDALMQAQLRNGGGTDIGRGVELCLAEMCKRDDVAGRFSSLLLLSDGATGGRDRVGIVDLVRQTLAREERSLVVNSLGFTSSCDVPLMQGVAADAGDTPGLFYFVRDGDPNDITAAIGDCLGVTQTIALTNLQIEVLPTRSAFDSDEPASMFGFVLDGAPTDVRRAKLGAMSLSQRHTFVLAHRGSAAAAPDELKLRVTYSVPGARHVLEHEFVLPCAVPADATLRQAAEMHCATHTFRARAAALLHRLCVGEQSQAESHTDVLEQIADLQEAIVQQINLMRISELSSNAPADNSDSTEKKKKKEKGEDDEGAAESASASASASLAAVAGAMALHDESVLEALSIDLGQVLFEQSGQRRASARSAGFAMRAYHEHHFQFSAHSSSGSLRAGPYTTPHQLESRLRFMESGDDGAAAKLAVPLESVELWGDDAEALALRRAVDEHVQCFVSLESWREASLGLALIVEPRTGRERRRGLLPRALLSGDVISTATYNHGVHALVQAAAPQQLDRDDVENADKHQVLPSSCRGRINAWLPLYICAENWRQVARYVTASVSIIGTQFNDQFSPELCLGVLSKLLIQSVVRFTVGGDVSERTLQQVSGLRRRFCVSLSLTPLFAVCRRAPRLSSAR